MPDLLDQGICYLVETLIRGVVTSREDILAGAPELLAFFPQGLP